MQYSRSSGISELCCCTSVSVLRDDLREISMNVKHKMYSMKQGNLHYMVLLWHLLTPLSNNCFSVLLPFFSTNP